jgi:hypothetical protein
MSRVSVPRVPGASKVDVNAEAEYGIIEIIVVVECGGGALGETHSTVSSVFNPDAIIVVV